MQRVLVTRPEPGASATAARLAVAGFLPVILPLTRIEPLPATRIDGAAFEAIAVTSANALRHAPDDLLATIRDLRCFAVGAETARLARERRFTDVRTADGDAAALTALITTSLTPAVRLLYLCGRLRRDVFEPALVEAGFAVTSIETYETLPVDYASDELALRLGEAPIAVATVYSAEAAAALVRLLRSGGQPAFAPPPKFLCISSRVAAILANEGLETVTASEPTERSMLSALRDISSGKP